MSGPLGTAPCHLPAIGPDTPARRLAGRCPDCQHAQTATRCGTGIMRRRLRSLPPSPGRRAGGRGRACRRLIWPPLLGLIKSNASGHPQAGKREQATAGTRALLKRLPAQSVRRAGLAIVHPCLGARGRGGPGYEPCRRGAPDHMQRRGKLDRPLIGGDGRCVHCRFGGVG
jgi:hypothetical protein